MYIKLLNEVSRFDVKVCGGKGASLGEMSQAGFPVPPGFVLTSQVYQDFSDSELPVELVEQIYQAFDSIDSGRVAVRSSAVAEDSKTASWAGQLESYLNTTKDQLIDNIRKCWNSIKSERALSYAAQQDLNEDDLVVAVVVQKMVNSESSGVMFTANPVTGDRDELMIESGFGLGEMLVQGMITPDNFVIDKVSLNIKSQDIQSQTSKLIYQVGDNKEVELTAAEGSKPSLTEDQVIELAQIGLKIEQHYGSPQDIEWALEKGKFYIVQSRPVTTIS